MDKEERNLEEARSLIKAGPIALITGISALCQFLTDSPSTVFSIGMGTSIISSTLGYGMDLLSSSEKRRLDRLGNSILLEIKDRLEQGHKPREDGFFDMKPAIRSSADELCDAILEMSRSEHQEKKISYIGNLYVSVAFTDEISPDEANRLLRLLKSATYREICILAMLSQEREQEGLRTNCLDKEKGSDELSSLMQECFELEGWGLLSQVNYDQGPLYGVPSWVHVIPANLRITPYGKRLAELSHLSKIHENDVQAIREIMRA
ncbi:hypothetical protein SAMN05216403_1095 [Nitrosospira multiformis ATCC 25196]|uniref:Uncharacterized protein n=1 Tax=Nitrosospira multiformis (strain ATCC 25196 / NCIMB 11849 / C 71) TaxID=323848 RepID=Q2Y5C8_NITMU|nr:hypothetical protein [Nitrosospira multiformis]ABB76043.1 hypothetical protein Nmul_A2756 [Nitrosospira multiformis ATCC 25196]SEF78064.1 hypothetical protein SAMN05216403_1095 [Nitrosospira multiformis ATCC 25196]